MVACPWFLNQWVNTLPIDLVLQVWDMAYFAPSDRCTHLCVALVLLDAVIERGGLHWTDGYEEFRTSTFEWHRLRKPVDELEGGALYAALATAGMEQQDSERFLEAVRDVGSGLKAEFIWSLRRDAQEALGAEDALSLEVRILWAASMGRGRSGGGGRGWFG